jgi:hypothetical protein
VPAGLGEAAKLHGGVSPRNAMRARIKPEVRDLRGLAVDGSSAGRCAGRGPGPGVARRGACRAGGVALAGARSAGRATRTAGHAGLHGPGRRRRRVILAGVPGMLGSQQLRLVVADCRPTMSRRHRPVAPHGRARPRTTAGLACPGRCCNDVPITSVEVRTEMVLLSQRRTSAGRARSA